MPVEITARHMQHAEGVQEHARSKGEALVSAFPRVEHVHVILEIERHRNIAKVVVQAKNHPRVEADEASADMYKSVDLAFERVEKQLRKEHDRVHDHRPGARETAS